MTIQLPEAFLNNIKAMMPEEEFPAFLRSYDAPYTRGVRTGGTLFPQDAGMIVPWEPEGRYLPVDSAAGADVLHEAGAYYLQQPSAMVPAAVLSPKEGDRVLDLCAAPGGKSTRLSRMVGKTGVLVANEINPARAKILSGNLERMGCTNTVVTSASPAQLEGCWEEWFDHVLVDAPCSGEGMFRRHPETIQEWTEDSPRACAERQRAILLSAVRMLKPGGRMVYSTCTFNKTENEDSVRSLLEACPFMHLVPFALPGLPAAKEGMLHIWPHQVNGEGHFCALLQKDGVPSRDEPAEEHFAPLKKEDKRCAESFLREYLIDPPAADTIFIGHAVSLPDAVPPLRGIKVLRLGLQLGEIRGQLFVPDHALARAGACAQQPALEKEEALRYLHGEVLPCGEAVKGWCTPMYRSCALGWGKASGGQIKNHYPKGLRIKY